MLLTDPLGHGSLPESRNVVCEDVVTRSETLLITAPQNKVTVIPGRHSRMLPA